MTDLIQIPTEYLERAERLTPLPKPPSTEELNQAGQPVVVTMDAQEIGALFAVKTTPYDFMQHLLAKFKAAGAPVEGKLRLAVAHGQVYKMKDDLYSKPGTFTYVWLPQPYCDALEAQGGLA